jgi:predicted transcriptional regulator
VAQRLLGGSVAPMIQRLIEQRRLTPEEANELRTLLDDYAEKGGE